MRFSLRTLIIAATVAGLTTAGASCDSAKPGRSADPRPSADPPSTVVVPTTASGPLVGPKTNAIQDTHYLSDLARVDSTLSSYLQSQGNTAVKALLTDGSAFCGFLERGGGIDNAMESLVIGADGVEAQTHLPSSVTTFNAIDAVALITLCPDEQKLVPPADQTKIRSLEKSLGGSS